MARQLHRLSDKEVRSKNLVPGRHSDGGGLYLVVDKSGAKRWVFLFRWDGKLKEMGLGGLLNVDLPMARAAAEAARKVLGAGDNPIDTRRQERPIPTFGDLADDLVKTLSPQWRNDKHKAQWSMTLKVHAEKLRARKVNEITTEHVLEVLSTLWIERPETASRLRGRIERVLDAARARGLRQAENPARWRGHLDHLLPKRQKLSRGHHKALAYSELPAFMASLRERSALAALALEFTILTASRTSEVLGATWAEIDVSEKIWNVPKERMKAGRDHRVPLSGRAIEILDEVKLLGADGLLFPGTSKSGGLSTGTMERLLDRMAVPVTVHGFRSTFRDWAGETTGFPSDVVEQALAHLVGSATERAYRRADALEKRRKLMEAWASYCARPALGNVTPFKRKG